MGALPFASADEHEAFVAQFGPKNARFTGGLLWPCSVCGEGFRTSDWPPVVCRKCRDKAKDEA